MQSEIEALALRVARLERANQRLKLVVIGGALAAAVFVSLGLGGKPRTVEAEKFVILDSRGRARLTLGTSGRAGPAVGMKPDVPAIWLSDEKGADKTILTPDGLYLADDHERPLVDLDSGPGRPGLRFYGPDGKISWSAP
jgi:hypothetical protein